MKSHVFCEVKAVDDDDPNGSFEVILSAPTLDRDGEVVDSHAFEPLPDHITFDVDHGMSVATTVGSGVPRYDEEGRLRVKGTYSSIPRAQELRTLVREGHIRTTSVAFMGAVREKKDGVPHVVKAELLNGAFVPIPANREAAVLVAKAFAEPAERKAHGMTANELMAALERAIREVHGVPEGGWTWVRDYADEWVVFEVSSDEELTTLRQTYTVTDGKVSLTGVAEPVVVHVTYAPAMSTNDPGLVATAAAPAAAAATKVPAPLAGLAAARAQAEAALVL